MADAAAFLRSVFDVWPLIMAEPEKFLFLAAVLIAVTFGIAWSLRGQQVENAKSARDAAKSIAENSEKLEKIWKTQYEIEHALRVALENRIAEKEKEKPDEITWKALQSVPQLHRFLMRLNEAGELRTSVDPSKSPDEWSKEDLSKISPAEIPTIAYAANTSVSGVTVTGIRSPQGFVTRLSPNAQRHSATKKNVLESDG